MSSPFLLLLSPSLFHITLLSLIFFSMTLFRAPIFFSPLDVSLILHLQFFVVVRSASLFLFLSSILPSLFRRRQLRLPRPLLHRRQNPSKFAPVLLLPLSSNPTMLFIFRVPCLPVLPLPGLSMSSPVVSLNNVSWKL